MEEQFYLLWPGLFCLFRGKKAFYLAITAGLSGPFLRTASYYLLPSLRGEEGRMFHTRLDILMMGCFAAFLLDSTDWRRRIAQIPTWLVVLPSSVFLFGIEPYLAGHFKAHTLARASVFATLPTAEAVAITALVLTLVAGRPGILGAVLNHPAVVFVGQRTYGMYLWQQLFLWPAAAQIQLLMGPKPPFTLLSLLLRLGASFLTALCSFRFLERPLLKLRKKFRRIPLE